jgi:carboxymethylenebutenolidase
MLVHTESITFRSGSETLAGYLAVPAGDGPHPALIAIHEVYGLNENMQDIARRYAEQGYVTLSVDLFANRNRAICMFRFFGGMIFNSTDNGAIRDLKAALDWLSARPDVDGSRVGAVGYCMGGGFAIAWACTDNRLKAIAPYYGMNPRPLEAVRRSCPVVGSYPTGDFTTEAGRKLDLALDEYAIAHDIKIYEGAKHSFMNDRGTNYDAAAAGDSWQRTIDFFKEHIG